MTPEDEAARNEAGITMQEWNEYASLISPFLPRHEGPVSAGINLEAAGLDSLGLIELVVAIEDHYRIELPGESLNWDTFETAQTLFSTINAVKP